MEKRALTLVWLPNRSTKQAVVTAKVICKQARKPEKWTCLLDHKSGSKPIIELGHLKNRYNTSSWRFRHSL